MILYTSYKEVSAWKLSYLELAPDALHACADEQGEGEIRIGTRVRRAQLHAVVDAVRRRDADELGAVLVAPCDVTRRFVHAEALIGIDERIEKGGHLVAARQNAHHKALRNRGVSIPFAVKDVFTVLKQRQIDVQTVARMIAVDFWQERRVQTVYRCHGLDRHQVSGRHAV